MSEGGSRNVRLVLAYDGTDFHGWQTQPGLRTVQGALEDAIARMTGVRSCARGAARTDAGVHAEGQVVTFRTASTIPAMGLARGLSTLLRPDVVVVSADDVPASFDARQSALGKYYRYRVFARSAPSPLLRRVTWWVRQPLDVAAMAHAARALIGTHDFAAFRAADCERPTTVRTITRLDVHEEGGEVRFEVEGTAFLKNMVRILVGTLVDVGRGKIAQAEVAAIRDGLDRHRAGRTAPAQGLTLVEVRYG